MHPVRTTLVTALVLVTATVATACSAASPQSSPSPSAEAIVVLDERPVQEQLVDAVISGDDAVAALALEAGADPSLVDTESESDPLSLAITRNDLVMVTLLLEYGATLERPETGFSQLQVAPEFAGADVVRALIDAGADPDGVGEGRGGPLSFAAYVGNVEMMTELLEAGANPNGFATEVVGAFPPLFSAAYGGSEEAVILLLEAGADPTVRSPEGHAPSDWADSQGHEDVGDLLRSLGA